MWLRTVCALVVACIAGQLVGCAGGATAGSEGFEPVAASLPERTVLSGPDPRALIVAAEDDRGHAFIVILLDGSDATTLTPILGGIEDVAVSADGSQIAYVQDAMADPYSSGWNINLNLLDVRSGELETLTDGLEVGAVSWGPDGELAASLWKWRNQDTGDVGRIRSQRFTSFSGGTEMDLWAFEDATHRRCWSLSIIGADDEWLYLLEGGSPSSPLSEFEPVAGLWRMPRAGGEPEALADFAPNSQGTVVVGDVTLGEQPVLERALDPQTLLAGEDSIVIAHRYDGHYHGSHEATVPYQVLAYRLEDGAIVGGETREQRLIDGFSGPPPDEGEVHLRETLTDPYSSDRRAEHRYEFPGPASSGLGGDHLVEIIDGVETTLCVTSSSSDDRSRQLYPLRYLPSGDLLYVSTDDDGTAVRRYLRETGDSETLRVLAPPREWAPHLHPLGFVF